MPYPDDHLLRSAHTRMYGVEPELVTHAPGRVNIIGEHIDYSGGIVLPLAIDRHASVGISRSTDPAMVRIHALDLEELYENTLDGYQLDPPGPGHWVHYILGPLVMLGEISLDRGIDLTCTSNVPIGAGLSSSAALEVAAARAASELLQLRRTPIELAKCCQQGEHRFAGVPCGLMDQATAAIAPAGTMLAFDCQDESWRVLNRPPDMGLIVIDSGVRHALGESAYRDRREAATQAADSLGWRSLRAAMDRGATDKLDQLPDHQRNAAQHAFSEMGRAVDAIKAIQSGDLRRLGMLMNESHTSLRDTLRVSCGEVDQIVDTACQHPSVLGARMTGGGFGGCILVLVPSDETESVAHEIIGACPSGINASIVPIDASTD